MKQVDNNSTNKNKKAKRRYEWNPKSKGIRVLTTMSCCSTNSIPEQYEQNFDIPWRRAATYRHSYIRDAGGNDSLHILQKLTCAICRTHTGNDGHHKPCVYMFGQNWWRPMTNCQLLASQFVRMFGSGHVLSARPISLTYPFCPPTHIHDACKWSPFRVHTLSHRSHMQILLSPSHTHASICVWTEMKNICINVS